MFSKFALKVSVNRAVKFSSERVCFVIYCKQIFELICCEVVLKGLCEARQGGQCLALLASLPPIPYHWCVPCRLCDQLLSSFLSDSVASATSQPNTKTHIRHFSLNFNTWVTVTCKISARFGI